MTQYVAFLRGINVGGNSLIKMADLVKIFQTLGYKNVKTILASGNVLFETAEKADKAVSEIEKKLSEKLKREIHVILRTIEEIKALIGENPFKNIKVTPETRLYITFLKEKAKTGFKIPYESPQKNFRILKNINNALMSVAILMPQFKTTEAMNIIEKEFGKKVTTRNWNTILKIAAKK